MDTARVPIRVAILVGSDSDLPVLEASTTVLEEFGVAFAITIASAHRTPGKVREFVQDSEKKGADVFIAAAGMAAALPGVVASETIKPVIGIPMHSKSLDGIDALLSIVQMPAGVPVATVAIGKAGAKNAALLALEILAVHDAALGKKLKAYKKKMSDEVIEKDNYLNKVGLKKYIQSKAK